MADDLRVMSIRTRKKASKKAGKKNARSAPRRDANKTRSGGGGKAQARPKGTRAPTEAKAKSKAKKSRITEPERSAPAMAEVDADVLEFIAAIDEFKLKHGRPFPSWSEVLMVVRQLGYRRD